MSLYTEIQNYIAHSYKTLAKQYSAKYVKEFIFGLSILVALFGGYVLHRLYVHHREQNAFSSLVEVVEAYNKSQQKAQALDPKKDKEQVDKAWEDTEILLNALYNEHMGSNLAPYFLVYKAQIMAEKGAEVDEVRKVVDDAVSQIPKGTPMFAVFNLKRIKMAFDSKKEEVRKAALKDLIDVTQDKDGFAFEEAVYLLGLYYLYQGDIDKAHESWKRLLENADKKALLLSTWVTKAENKLALFTR